MEHPKENIENLTIAYDRISTNKSFTSVTRNLATKLTTRMYLSLKDFFQELSDKEFDELIYLIQVYEHDENAQCELILLTEMLSRAEGIVSSDEKTVSENCGYFVMVVAGVSLERKGVIRILYDNLTFDRDMLDEVIFVGCDDV